METIYKYMIYKLRAVAELVQAQPRRSVIVNEV